MTEPAFSADRGQQEPAPPIVPSAHATNGPSPSQRISPTHLEALDRMGFVRLPSFFDAERQIAPILYDLTRAGRHFSERFDHRSAETIRALPEDERAAFDRLRDYLPSLNRLASSDTMLDLSRATGLRFPMVRRQHPVCLTMPNESAEPGPWQQDIVCHLGSKNSVGYWIPLTEANAETGTVEVIPGSHRDGVRPFSYRGKGKPRADTAIEPADIEIEETQEDDAITIEAKPGDLLITSQFLVQRQRPNRSERPHWWVEIRHADGFEQDFIDAGYPCGDETNIYHTGMFGSFKAARS